MRADSRQKLERVCDSLGANRLQQPASDDELLAHVIENMMRKIENLEGRIGELESNSADD